VYAVGTPDENSPVLVTANYKLTVDKLREELHGFNLWILVIDTNGVNVWCAAGKGTFSTEEIICKIQKYKLKEVDTEGIKPTYHVNDTRNAMREDKVEKSLAREKVLLNGPDKENGYFKIPKVLD